MILAFFRVDMDKNAAVIYGLLIFASLAWAGSFIAVRLIYEQIPPVVLGFLRFLVATPVMFCLLISLKKRLFLPIKELPKLIVLGLTGVTFLYIFQFVGVSLTTASTGGVLINTNVLFIAFFSALFLHEQFSLKKTVGILISFAGVFLVVIGQMTNEALVVNQRFLFGCLLIILSAVCWATYSIVGKNLLRNYESVTVTTNAFLLGTLFYLPFVIPDVFPVVQSLSVQGLFAVLYLGLFCSVFAYLSWYHALSHLEAAQSAVFLNFIPLFTILLSFFIGEYPTPLFFVGAVFIMYGVYLTQKSRVKKITL